MAISEDSRLERPSLCPECGAVLDAASPVVGEHTQPKVGDVSVCLVCGELLVFGLGMAIAKMEPATFRALEPNEQTLLLEAQRLARSLNLKGRQNPERYRGRA